MNAEDACDICQQKRWMRYKNDKFVCLDCEPPMLGLPANHKTVYLDKGDGTKYKTKEREIKEFERARILPYDKPGGGYYHGRMGDNGKIQEKPLKQV